MESGSAQRLLGCAYLPSATAERPRMLSSLGGRQGMAAEVDSTRIAYETGPSRTRVLRPRGDVVRQRPVARLRSIERVELHLRLAEARGSGSHPWHGLAYRQRHGSGRWTAPHRHASETGAAALRE